MHPEFAATVNTASSTTPPTVLARIEIPTESVYAAPGNTRHYVLSAIACGLALHLALMEPSLASSDEPLSMVLAGDPADPFSLTPHPRANADTDLITAVHSLVADVPDHEWQKLPTNLASGVDELLYDRPNER